MWLTKVPDPGGDDYHVHQHLSAMFDRQNILFQRRGFEIDVLSPRAVVDSRDVARIIDAIAQGKTMLFTIRMNPAVTRFIGGKNRRIAMEPEKIRLWVEGMLAKHGCAAAFAIRHEGHRCSQRVGQIVTLASILVSGILTVTDPALFRDAVCRGIGHGKGMGFGFLNVFSFE